MGHYRDKECDQDTISSLYLCSLSPQPRFTHSWWLMAWGDTTHGQQVTEQSVIRCFENMIHLFGSKIILIVSGSDAMKAN